MDPDGTRTSTRVTLLAATGQIRWPPAGSYMAATGQHLMAADSRAAGGIGTDNHSRWRRRARQPPAMTKTGSWILAERPSSEMSSVMWT